MMCAWSPAVALFKSAIGSGEKKMVGGRPSGAKLLRVMGNGHRVVVPKESGAKLLRQVVLGLSICSRPNRPPQISPSLFTSQTDPWGKEKLDVRLEDNGLHRSRELPGDIFRRSVSGEEHRSVDRKRCSAFSQFCPASPFSMVWPATQEDMGRYAGGGFRATGTWSTSVVAR